MTAPSHEKKFAIWGLIIPIIVAIIGCFGLIIATLLTGCFGNPKLCGFKESPVSIPTQQPTTAPNTLIPTITTIETPEFNTLTCDSVSGIELLNSPWKLEGENGDAQEYQEIESNILQGKNALIIIYDLNGMMALEGELRDASAIIFDQPNWHVISLANYGTNGLDEVQTVVVKLTEFIGIPDESAGVTGGTILDPSKPVGTLHVRFWYATKFVVDIYSICVFNLQ